MWCLERVKIGPVANNLELHEWATCMLYKTVEYQRRWWEFSNATDKGGLNKIGWVGTWPIGNHKRLGRVCKISKTHWDHHLSGYLVSLKKSTIDSCCYLGKLDVKKIGFNCSVQLYMVLICVSRDAFGRSTPRGSESGLFRFIAMLGGWFSMCLALFVAILSLSMVRSFVSDINAVVWSLFLVFWTPVPSFFFMFNWLEFFVYAPES